MSNSIYLIRFTLIISFDKQPKLSSRRQRQSSKAATLIVNSVKVEDVQLIFGSLYKEIAEFR